MVDLTISIVSWNIKDLLDQCLKSVYENTKGITYEVFVADNGSADGSVEMMRQKYPQVTLIANTENLGFTKANNQIIRQANGRYVILLNSDTIVTPGSLETLVRFMDEHPDAGAVGPRLEYPDGSFQLSCRSFPTLETEFYRLSFLDQLFAKSPLFGKYMMTFWPHDDIREVDQPMGAALLARRETVDQIGLLDENIIFWYDEVDWCKRIKDRGWKIFFTPEAKIYHYKNKGFAQWKGLRKNLRGMRIWRSSRNYYFKKHHGILSVIIINLMDIIQTGFFAMVLYLLARGIISLWNFVF